MTTILDSELKFVPNWNLKIVGLLEEVGLTTRFFFVIEQDVEEAQIGSVAEKRRRRTDK
jgi:hypothetical protein